MNLVDAKKKIQSYLDAKKSWPLIVDVQTKQDCLELIDYFEVGENKFCSGKDFCNEDGSLKLEELYDAVSVNTGDTFYVNLTGFLKLQGKETAKNVLKTLVTTSISGHVLLITYQCGEFLRFADPRISESGRVLIVSGQPDEVPEMCFFEKDLKDAFPAYYDGLEDIGEIVETCQENIAYIATDAKKGDFPQSLLHISQLANSYDILVSKDPETKIVQRELGTKAQWNYALKKMGSGNWKSLIETEFGAISGIYHTISKYSSYDENKKWLYYISLLLCGTKENEYLQSVLDSTLNYSTLIESLIRRILDVDKSSEEFAELYKQRKDVLSQLKDYTGEIVSFCKVLATKGEDAIYYLTDLTDLEKERAITWLDAYGSNYSTQELIQILGRVYPDLASYLSRYNFKNELLDSYFEAYKYQKVTNQILPSFEKIVDEQAEKNDFVGALKPRTSIVDKLDVENAEAYFVDAMGVEYLGFVQDKCNQYGLSANITCGRCELPSITSHNKEFVESLEDKGCNVVNIKELDEIKHHGKDNFDYEKEKTPVYLVRELEIIDELLQKIRANIDGDKYKKAIIISDHGASRLAVLHNTENTLCMETSGEHSGRCCPTNEINEKPDAAIEEGGFWVLANYDRFKGSRKANVEVHGGASIEEVAVPIIEITRKGAKIEAFVVEESKTVKLGAKEHAALSIYADVKSNNICIKLDGKYFDAEKTSEPYIYAVELPEYTQEGNYSFDILDGSDIIASGQEFRIEKKGMKKNFLFDDF